MKSFNNAIGPQVRQKRAAISMRLTCLVGFVFLALSFQISTQLLAYQFNYHPSLGSSIHHVYSPWSSIFWMSNWGALYPNLFALSIGVIAMINSIPIIVFLIYRKSVNKDKSEQYQHGSARWANMDDIKKAKLLNNNDGVYVGAYEDDKGKLHYLRHSGPEHILTNAPTRSGKGVGLVIPTLLSWEQSAVITDLKGELWGFTAGWRKQYANNKVLRFEPASSQNSVCWNPLDEIRIGTAFEVGDAQNLATLIVDPDGKGLITHWQKTSQSLLVGLILHAIYKLRDQGEIATLASIDELLVNPEQTISSLLVEMTEYRHTNGDTHPVVSASARDMLDRPEEEAGSVLSTLKSYLSLYRDPVVANNISVSDFKIKDLMNYDTPVSLYIVTQPNDKARLRPLIRVLLNMIVRLLADKMDFEKSDDGITKLKPSFKHRLLCMIDEFPSLGKLEILQESLAFVTGYGLKFYLICQDINQLKSREMGYGPDESITSNCHIQNAYPPNRIETAEYLSKLTGITTVTKKHVTTSGKRTSAYLSQISKTNQTSSRPLLTADECQRMLGPIKDENGMITSAGDMVIYVAGFPAIYGKQPLYFQDPVFLVRASVDAPLQSDIIRSFCPPQQEIKL